MKHIRILVCLLHIISLSAYAGGMGSPNLPSVTCIHVQGNVDVDLHSNYKHTWIDVQGAESLKSNVHISFKNHQLYVQANKTIRPEHHLKIVIHANHINRFIYNGRGTITGPKLNLHQSIFHINNDGTTNLAGHLGLKHFKLYGGGTTTLTGLSGHEISAVIGGMQRVILQGNYGFKTLRMSEKSQLRGYWVNAYAMKIYGNDFSKINLAGVANKTEIILKDNAQFNGQYLRIRTAFVNTSGNAKAAVTTLEAQHAKATDNSSIVYYQKPAHFDDHMAYQGRILDGKACLFEVN